MANPRDFLTGYRGLRVPRVTVVISSAPVQPNTDTADIYVITGQNANTAFNPPNGATPVQGQELIIRMKDDGTARTISWDAIYRSPGSVALPLTTVVGKTLYMRFVYNSTDTKWDLVRADSYDKVTTDTLLALKAPLASPTFTGTVGLPITNVSGALTLTGSNLVIGDGNSADALVEAFVLSNVGTVRIKGTSTDAQAGAVLTITSGAGTLKLGPGGATAPGFTITATGAAAATMVGTLTLPGPVLSAGTTAIASIVYTSGSLLTTPVAGAQEFDGTQFYATVDTTSGRGMMPAEQYFRLAADGGTISTIANFFGATSNIALVANAYYEIEVFCWFLNTTAGTVVWTFTNSAAPTSQNIHYRYSPIGGVNTGAGGADYLEGDIIKDATAAKALTVSGTLVTAVNHYAHFKIWLRNGTGTSLKIQATKGVGGTITPLYGSYWKARRLPASSTGTFAA